MIVYHGTNLFSAKVIQKYGVWLSVQRPFTDFGRGFYVTHHLQQAKKWAEVRALHPQVHPLFLKRLKMTEEEYLRHPDTQRPAYLIFHLDIGRLRTLRGKIFPSPRDPKWPRYYRLWISFVARCRAGAKHPYDFVFGPVAGWHPFLPDRIRLTFRKDQLSLNSPRALQCLSEGIVVTHSPAKPKKGFHLGLEDDPPLDLDYGKTRPRLIAPRYP